MSIGSTIRLTGLAVLASGSLLASAFAAGDAPTERQTLMGNVGAATGAGAKMVKGEVEFDLVAAQLALRTMNTAGLAFGYMFPDGSQTGAKTEASPKIWEDRAGFDAAVNKFIADTSGAEKVTDLESFKAAFGAATANCGSCHKAYRVKN
ncbi:MAG: cytochrome c [Pseudomonadota bacterium]